MSGKAGDKRRKARCQRAAGHRLHRCGRRVAWVNNATGVPNQISGGISEY